MNQTMDLIEELTNILEVAAFSQHGDELEMSLLQRTLTSGLRRTEPLKVIVCSILLIGILLSEY